LSAGALAAKALRFEAPDEVHGDYEIPREFWAEAGPSLRPDDLLGPGDFDIRLGCSTYRIFGLSMRRTQIEAMCDSHPDLTEKSQPGRPRATWWDDFWVYVATELYYARFEPETQSQADLQRLMLDWAEAHGHPLAEGYAKEKARKLLDALRKGKNP
jgi:hypothetical protein